MAPTVAKQAAAVFSNTDARPEIAAYLADPATLAQWRAAPFRQQVKVFVCACKHGALTALPLIRQAMQPRVVPARRVRRMAPAALANARADELDLLAQYGELFGADVKFATRECLYKAAEVGNVPALEWATAQFPAAAPMTLADASMVLKSAARAPAGPHFEVMDWLLRDGHITPDNFAGAPSDALVYAASSAAYRGQAPVLLFEWVRAAGLPVAALKHNDAHRRGDERIYVSALAILEVLNYRSETAATRQAILAGLEWLQIHCPIGAGDIDPTDFLCTYEVTHSVCGLRWACRLVTDLGLWERVDQCRLIRNLMELGYGDSRATADEMRAAVFDIGWDKTAEVGVALLKAVSGWRGERPDKSCVFYARRPDEARRPDAPTEGDLLLWIRRIEREWPVPAADLCAHAPAFVQGAALVDNVSVIVYWCAALDLDYGAISRTREWSTKVVHRLILRTIYYEIPPAEQLALLDKYGAPEADFTDSHRYEIVRRVAADRCIFILPYLQQFCGIDGDYYRRNNYAAVYEMLEMASVLGTAPNFDYLNELCSFWHYRCGLGHKELIAAFVARIRHNPFVEDDTYEVCNIYLLELLVNSLGFTVRDMRAAGLDLLTPALTHQYQRRDLFQLFDFTVDDIDALIQLVPPLPPFPPFRYNPNHNGDIDYQRKRHRRRRAALVENRRTSIASLLARRAKACA